MKILLWTPPSFSKSYSLGSKSGSSYLIKAKVLLVGDWAVVANSWNVPALDNILSCTCCCCRYGSPILSIKWHQTLNSTEPKLITADKHTVRVWDPNTVSSSIFLSLESAGFIFSWKALTLLDDGLTLFYREITWLALNQMVVLSMMFVFSGTVVWCY